MRINDKVFAGIQDKSTVAQFLFNTAVNAKVKALRDKVQLSLWDLNTRLLSGRLSSSRMGLHCFQQDKKVDGRKCQIHARRGGSSRKCCAGENVCPLLLPSHAREFVQHVHDHIRTRVSA